MLCRVLNVDDEKQNQQTVIDTASADIGSLDTMKFVTVVDYFDFITLN